MLFFSWRGWGGGGSGGERVMRWWGQRTDKLGFHEVGAYDLSIVLTVDTNTFDGIGVKCV